MTQRSLVPEMSRRHLLQLATATMTGVAVLKSTSREALGNSAEAAPAAHYLLSMTDPEFGSKVVKVTEPLGPVPGLDLIWGKVARHHYSIDQAWNADQTLLALDRGTKPRVYLDGKTYKPLMARPDPGEIRWHPQRAEFMIFVSAQGVGLWHVKKNETHILNPLKGYQGANFGDHKGNPSDDGKRIAITAKRDDGKNVVFVVNLETGEKLADIDMSSEYKIGHTSVSPKGALIIAHSWRSEDKQSYHRRVFTLDGKLLQTWLEYERPGHGDFTIDNNGDEVFVGRSKSDPERWQIIKRRLVDGHVTVLSPPCFASHVSARNTREPGWVFATFAKGNARPSFAPYKSEITALAIDGSQRVRRLVQTHAVTDGYLTEPHGSASPDGRRVIFASNWGIKGGPIAAYVAEFA
ncbi:MAG: hypothetical protein E6Q98_12675 [Rhodospirillaceae bacterium]|nr:MAG: hypothetical protein E6Q98_12675 [Rhodospirillaceae bacterium]